MLLVVSVFCCYRLNYYYRAYMLWVSLFGSACFTAGVDTLLPLSYGSAQNNNLCASDSRMNTCTTGQLKPGQLHFSLHWYPKAPAHPTGTTQQSAAMLLVCLSPLTQRARWSPRGNEDSR